jgi:hypothetical protein
MVSMNGKSWEGLSLEGMASHIASAILLWNKGQGVGTKNDCKLIVSYVVRKYQAFSAKANNLTQIPSTLAARRWKINGKKPVLEHGIPVACVVNGLFHIVTGPNLQSAIEQVETCLEANTVLAWVTPREHSRLNARFAQSMPVGYDSYPWKDKWARYRKSLVDIPDAGAV